MPITICIARSVDADVVAAVRDRVAHALLQRGIEQWRPGERRAAHFRQLAGSGHLYVVEDDGECAGAFSCFLSDPVVWGPRPDDAVYVHDLMVDPRAQGRGYGAQLLGWAEDFAGRLARRQLRLDCAAASDGLRAYYRAQGFAEVGEKRFAWKGWSPVVLLERPVRQGRAAAGSCSGGRAAGQPASRTARTCRAALRCVGTFSGVTIPFVLEFRSCDPEESPARELIAAMVGELMELYGTDGPPGVPLDIRELAAPTGTYVVAFVGDEPVAGVGLRAIGASLGEIKRMYVVPAWRGRGVARRLLAAIEDAARDLDYRVVRLDTGTAQPDAQHIYETSGYRRIGDYNGNGRAAFWGEKVLSEDDTPSGPVAT